MLLVISLFLFGELFYNSGTVLFPCVVLNLCQKYLVLLALFNICGKTSLVVSSIWILCVLSGIFCIVLAQLWDFGWNWQVKSGAVILFVSLSYLGLLMVTLVPMFLGLGGIWNTQHSEQC